MTTYLTVDSVLALHNIVKKHFRENTAGGKIDRDKIQSIVDKPRLRIANQEIYATIYEKAACILESFCREHVFADGNKRIAVLAMFTFLTTNGYPIAMPFSTVKYTVNIAKSTGQEPEDIEIMIKSISQWLEKRSSTNSKDHKKKLMRYVFLPWIGLILLQSTLIGIPIQYMILQDWFQTKMHPEYKYRMWLPMDFILVIPSKLKCIINQQ